MQKAKFLSDEWFSNMESVEAELGDLEVPPGLSQLAWNMVVEMPDGTDLNMSMQGMMFRRDEVADASSTLFLEAELARRWFIEGDATAGIFAFMSGDMRIEGNVHIISALQSEAPSERMKLFGERLREFTLS